MGEWGGVCQGRVRHAGKRLERDAEELYKSKRKMNEERK